MLKIKLFAAFALLAFASGAFLFSNNSALAQSSETAKKRDEVLEKVADYKLWKQVRKPETELDLLKKDAPSVILDSTAMG